MRELTEHRVNEANEKLVIEVMDEPGQGGACHRYVISGYDGSGNASAEDDDPVDTIILFQNGPIKEAGVNGITQEALLAICADRLRCFQAGPYAHPSNAEALTHIEAAQKALQMRTKERLARGVEGTNTV